MSGLLGPRGFPRRCWVSRPAEPGASLAGQFHELCRQAHPGEGVDHHRFRHQPIDQPIPAGNRLTTGLSLKGDDAAADPGQGGQRHHRRHQGENHAQDE